MLTTALPTPFWTGVLCALVVPPRTVKGPTTTLLLSGVPTPQGQGMEVYVMGKVCELQLVPRMMGGPYHVLLSALVRGAKPKTLKPWCEERNHSGPATKGARKRGSANGP